MAFWYNIATAQVEEDGQTEPKGELMGPYETREAAQGALASAARRTEQWDQENREQDEGGSSSWGNDAG